MDITKLTPEMLRTIPAMKQPLGHKTNFADPGHDGSNAQQTMIVESVLTALTVVILLLRLYTKLVVVRSHGWDDYLAAGATGGDCYLNAILYIYKHFMLMTKLSLCVFFKIFRSNPLIRWAIYFAVFYNVVLQVAAFFTSIFFCIPGRPSFWGCSHKVSVLNIVTSGFNIFNDFYLLILPLFAIWQLQMRSVKKLALTLVFRVGLLACIASILGLIYRLRQDASQDVSWSFAPEIILVTFELNATIMVCCLLTMPVLFRSQHCLGFSSLWSRRSTLLVTSRASNSGSSNNLTVAGTRPEKNVSRLSNNSGDSLIPVASPVS